MIRTSVGGRGAVVCAEMPAEIESASNVNRRRELNFMMLLRSS